MTKTSKVLLVFAVTMIGLMSFFTYNSYRQETNSKSYILSHKETVPIIVLHSNAVIEEKNIIHHLDAEHLFLMLKKKNTMFLFTKLEQLRPYDKDHDNIVDNRDPIFNNLYIGRFDNKQKVMVYHPIQKTAIRAIRLDTDKKNTIVKGQAIYMGNHQHGPVIGLFISPRSFPKEDFQHLKLKPRFSSKSESKSDKTS